jgi:hypothetical protein
MILRYPVTNLFGRSFSLQRYFYGLEFYDEEVRFVDIKNVLNLHIFRTQI